MKLLKPWRIAVRTTFAVIVMLHSPPAARAQSDDLGALNLLVARLAQAGKYAEAIGLAKRALALAERKFGPDHPDVEEALTNLARLYKGQGRYADAEPLYKRALAIDEKALGPDHPDVAAALNSLAVLFRAQGRYAEAEPLYRRTLAIVEKALGPERPEVGVTLNNLALLYKTQGRYAEAEPLYRRALAIYEKALGPDDADVGAALNNLAQLYSAQNRYAEAEPLLKRALAVREKALGSDHPEVGQSLNNLAGLYQAQGRYGEVEPLRQRALAIYERALGPDHPDLGTVLNGLAELYWVQGRYGEAEPLYRRALAIYEKAVGPDHPDLGNALNSLAKLYRAEGRYGEAEPLYQRALAIDKKALGPDHPSIGNDLNNLAVLYHAQGRYAEAEPLFKRALAILEKALGPDKPSVGSTLNSLAALYRDQGRYGEAEPLYQRALAIGEKAQGPDHPDVGDALNNLALLYTDQGRYAEAELLYQRALAIDEKSLGSDHPRVGTDRNNLAQLYSAQSRYGEAEPLLKRALAIREKALGPDHPEIGSALTNLASLLQDTNHLAEAEPLYRRALAINEKALGPGHPEVGITLNNLAALYRDQGRYAEAEPLYQRTLAIVDRALGPDHPYVAGAFNNLADLHFLQHDWAPAADFWRRSTGVIIRRVRRGTLDLGQVLTGKRKSEAQQHGSQFSGLVKVAYRLASEKQGADVSLRREMFQTAQWASASEAAQSLAQMAARGAKGDPALATLVRERQDLVAEWQKRDALRSAAVAQAPDKRNRPAEAENVARLAAIDARIAEIDKRLKADFPDYAALASPSPLSVEDVQAQLGAGEALVLFLDTPEWKPTPEETFIWVVTKRDSRWVRIDLGTKALTERVQKLRAGLDRNAATRAAVQIGEASPAARGFLPFDIAVAHELYSALFGQIVDLIKDKQLLIVPSGPLTSLPFHVLVTEKPQQAVPDTVEGFASVAWLVKRNAITVLPSVASLAALRQHARGRRAPDPYLGFGNPLLVGASGADRRAWSMQNCGSPDKRIVVASLAASEQRGLAEFFRGGAANVAAVRSLAPLPETAEELCEVGQRLGARDKDILLGPAATETAVKAMSADGRLARARVVHFATHGLIAGELKGLAEPALVLSPPADGADASALQQDDGLLTASEVAELKLNADWVVLSACNTAAGEGNAEALSGLARAFFYAGARALLVSHWPVNSGAAVKLTTRAFTALEQDPNIGRAEALRQAMLATIAEGGSQAHPSYWAPFVVVGEGARL